MRLFVRLFVFLGLVSGFSNAPQVIAAEPLQIVTTTAQIGDMVREIGGDAVEVTALMGEGVDPHTYRQSRRDVLLLRGADLIIANGLYLEAQLEPLLATLAEEQAVILLGDLIDPAGLLSHADYAGKFDPHVWMDVGLWADVMQALTTQMIEIRPEHAEAFKANSARYFSELQNLDNYVATAMASIPEASRVLISAHDAFQYFAKAYGIQVEGIQGLSTESEAGLKRIEDLVGLITRQGVGAVFVESSVAQRNIQALIEGAAARGHEVRIGGSLYSDAMGQPGSYEGTYMGMLDHNATTIARALGGDVPERGLNGKMTTEILAQ